MERRTSEKDKEIIKSGTYKASDRFMRKSRANSQFGNLSNDGEVNMSRIESVRQSYIVWAHENAEHQLFNPMDYSPGTPHRQEFSITLPQVKWKITGYCAICNSVLTEDYPEDYPEEYKFCCSCIGWARLILTEDIKLDIEEIIRRSPTIRKIYYKVTLFDGKTKEKWKKRNEEWGRLLNERKK